MGKEKMLEEGDARDRWIEKSLVLYDLILQSVNNDMFQHIKDLVELDDSGPKAWKLLRDGIQPNTLLIMIVLEKELAALSMRPGDDVKPVLEKIKYTYARTAVAGSNVSQMQQCTKIISVLNNSWDNLIPTLNTQQNQWTPEWLRQQILQEDFHRSHTGGGAANKTAGGCIKDLWQLPIIPWNGKLSATTAAAATAKATAGAEETAASDGALDAVKKVQQPQQPHGENGVAERFNRTLQEGARTLLGRAGLPDPFWVTALRQVAFVKNRVLATVGDKQWVPYTKWYGSAPAVNMLRAYGCMVVFHVPKEKRGKLEASGRWGVHLGLAKDHKGWLIWDLTSQWLTMSRDVKFLESLYYKEWKQQQQKLPTTPLIIEFDEVQRPSRQVQVTVSDEEISGVTDDGGKPEVEEQQQQQDTPPSGSSCMVPQARGDTACWGFKKSECDHSLFLLQEKEQLLMLLVYVDDILLLSESSTMIEHVEEMLEMQFKKYCEGRAENYGLQDGGKPATPLPWGFTLEPCADEEVVGESDRKLFHSMVGALNYAANHTRPDIAFATSRLASVVSRPSHELLEVAKRLVCYVSATASVGLGYSAVRHRLQRGAADLSKGEMLLTCYTVASFNSVKADGTSIGGYVCLFGGGAVSWRSKKQNEVGLSSCETEYMALHHGVKEVVLLRRLLEEIRVCQREPTVMFCDNESAVKLAKNACLHGLTKHIRPNLHWVRRLLDKEVQLEIVKTYQQAADILTKRLAEPELWKGMKFAGMSVH
ncbi:unnamed protein product [Closterium sp. NIES-54]